MDVTFENTSNVEEKRWLPDSDYTKNGKLKKLRGRVLKKLFKYEFRALMPAFLASIALLFSLTFLLCLFLRVTLDFDNNSPVHFENTLSALLLVTVILYVLCLGGICIFSIANAMRRYQKNFFKEEGYLTFSLPASAQEHIFAKRVSGITMSLITALSCVISLLLVIVFSVGEISIGSDVSIPNPPPTLSDFFQTVEQLLLAFLSLVSVYCISGAACCWGQKFRTRGQIIWRLVLAYVVLVVLESVATYLGEFGLTDFFYTTVTGEHVGRWLAILGMVGACVFCVWYEIRTLTKKLNLK